MSDIMKGHLPVVRLVTDEPICHKAPDIICSAFGSCIGCPFNDLEHVAVMLIIERESDHEKN